MKGAIVVFDIIQYITVGYTWIVLRLKYCKGR